MKANIICYCNSEKPFEHCCKRFINDGKNPHTAEELMRSRYSAYVLANAKYLIDTVHPKTRHFHSKKSILKWAQENRWQKLEIVKATENSVSFKAYFKNTAGGEEVHFENSVFEKLGGKWYYVSGEFEEQ